ncbi:hypothetical protein EJV47_11600 [Hymenobacter gummosus]|uniref:Uncharacterized protein n=1 Tax=Hymenobacter gummosus TaxID=1776032 RepID=A0A431U445_9BACT|nr:hypothetical protein [Hymenobacter gummosus]RTQ50264.1 hypothetical protein EJV47_11600 [Hymenobacter gummosus]
MSYLSLVLSLLLASPAPAQTAPKPRAAQAATSSERVAQYHRDYLERLRAAYFAPGDPRATALLSTATEELSARRKALRAELTAALPGKTGLTIKPTDSWRQELAALNKTPQAVKFFDRCRRNPALETAYQRFLDARLDELFPEAAGR